jgi:kynurenine formamidase
MKRDTIKRATLIIPLLFILFFYYVVSTRKQMSRIKKDYGGQMNTTQGMLFKAADAEGKDRWFGLGEPLRVSREVLFKGGTEAPNAFHLTPISSRTVEFEGQFIGDVRRGGSCNVDTLSYVPHGLTHLETSAHILNPDTNPPTVKDIPAEKLSGMALLIDLSERGEEAGQKIPWEAVQAKLERNTLPISMLAIKTVSSLLPQDYDFSGKDFLCLSPVAAKGIHDYKAAGSRIDCLILDLPSIDRESDGGKLLAHRGFFGLPDTGFDGVDTEKRALVELAIFSGLKEGYYYVTITPPLLETNAVSTGIIFRPMTELE